VSTSETKSSSYHHGDLRNALIAAGVDMLAETSIDALSLRKLAARVGVSHNAPYMHFADKEALLAAIAEEGFHLLAGTIEMAMAGASADWYTRFESGCWGYVTFVIDHPAHATVMFRRYDPEKYPEQARAALGTLRLLETIIEEGQATGQVIDGSPPEIAATIWALLHGIAVALAARKMPPSVMGDRSARELMAHFLRTTYTGLQPHPA
jgi:AcrR family transcriptional regulator